VNFIFFSTNEAHLKIYHEAAYEYTDAAVFYATNAEAMREKFNVNNERLIVIKDFDDIRTDYAGELTFEGMEQFFRLECAKWEFPWG